VMACAVTVTVPLSVMNLAWFLMMSPDLVSPPG